MKKLNAMRIIHKSSALALALIMSVSNICITADAAESENSHSESLETVNANSENKRPALSVETEKILRQDYLQKLKAENPNTSYIQDLTVSDIQVMEYYGTYDGCEAVIMWERGLSCATVSKTVQIGNRTFSFPYESYFFSFYLHKDHDFIPITDAYEEGILDDTEIDAIWNLFGYTVKDDCKYTDISEDDWFYSDVYHTYRDGIMTGLDEYTFGPNQPLARAQLMVILHRMAGKPEASLSPEPDWPDVTEDWYKNAVYWGFQSDIMKGYDNSDYWGTVDNITREQLATVMYRYAEYRDYDTSGRKELNQFTDAGSVSDFAKEAMQWAVWNGIITGKDNATRLDPQGHVTRAECAKVIQAFIRGFGKPF